MASITLPWICDILHITIYTDGPKGTTNSREYVKLQRQNKQLLEENNLLKYKIELLLDMVSVNRIVNWVISYSICSWQQAMQTVWCYTEN